MSHGHFLRALKEHGLAGTFKQLYKLRTLKFGTLIGIDKLGNKYFENTKDYPHGQHRWVEYAGDKSFYEVDSSVIPAEWHGWIHHVTAAPPTERTTGTVYRVEPLAISHGSSAPYKRNLGGVVAPHTPNLSSFKPRGYGLGNGLTDGSTPGQELFYTQPGFPLDKRNSVRRGPRRALSFSLADTPATLKAKAAGRHGLSVADWERFSHPDSPTRLALRAPGAGGDDAGVAETAADLLAAEDGVHIPSDPVARERAMRIANVCGHARPWGAEVERGTFAAAVQQALSAEEAALLDSGADEDDLAATVQQYQRTVDAYSHIADREVAVGVAVAAGRRDAALAELVKLRAVHAKVAAVAAKFDASSVEAARAQAVQAPLA